jgi:hypothetical protein
MSWPKDAGSSGERRKKLTQKVLAAGAPEAGFRLIGVPFAAAGGYFAWPYIAECMSQRRYYGGSVVHGRPFESGGCDASANLCLSAERRRR